MKVALVSQTLLATSSLLHRVNFVAYTFNLHFLLLKHEVIHFVNDSTVALLAYVYATILADTADCCGLVDGCANDRELWLDVTNDPTHDTARVDADFYASYTTVMQCN